MEGYAGWWTKNGMIGLPPQTRVKGVGRHNNNTVYMDFSKAFDTVPHRRLLGKLEAYGIDGSLLILDGPYTERVLGPLLL